MTEAWLPVVGFEGFYEVSSAGGLRSANRRVNYNDGRTRLYEEQTLRGWQVGNGYWRTSLWRDNTRTDIFLHRLVCEAFHGAPPTPAHEVAHKDGNPSNCDEANLRWATHAENMGDKRAHGTHTCGERHSRAKLTLAEVRQIIASPDKGCVLARRFEVTDATICDIKKGRSWGEALVEVAAP